MKDFEAVYALACESIDIYNGGEVFLQTFADADSDAATVYAAQFCESEICNGGFRQFFSNSTGVLAPEAIEAFTRLGMPNTADVVQKACERIGRPYPRERALRRSLLNEVDFGDLDQRFYDARERENGGFEAAKERFIAGLTAPTDH